MHWGHLAIGFILGFAACEAVVLWFWYVCEKAKYIQPRRGMGDSQKNLSSNP